MRLIRFVICGLEHSGTTLVSDLFRQVPGIDAGFEVGVLLAETPRGFPAMAPFSDIALWSWGVDRDVLAACCDTDDFVVFYERLSAASTVLRPGTTSIFDKTPRYLADLASCMAKLPVPFVVVHKDPRATVYSDYIKAGSPDFTTWFEPYAAAKIGYMRAPYAEYRRLSETRNPRACVVRLEDICLDSRRTCERLYAHIGESFDPAYMLLRHARYENTRLGAISAGIPFAYLTHFGPLMRARIAEAFSEFSDWFYD